MTDKTNTGGAASPFMHVWEGGTDSSEGMSLRDWYAGMALQGYCANSYAWEERTPDEQIKMSFLMGDAMIAEREK